jgi:hypothetical protein
VLAGSGPGIVADGEVVVLPGASFAVVETG